MTRRSLWRSLSAGAVVRYGMLAATIAVGGFIAFSSGPGQSFVFSVFIDSMIEDTGFSRPAISALYTVSTGVSALMVAVVSRMADRWGARSNLILVGLAFGAACFGMAFSTSFAAFSSISASMFGSWPTNWTT